MWYVVDANVVCFGTSPKSDNILVAFDCLLKLQQCTIFVLPSDVVQL